MMGNLLQYANIDMTLVNGALAKNIFWQIPGNVKHLEGIALFGLYTKVMMITESSLKALF
jgi:hypothetical protein